MGIWVTFDIEILDDPSFVALASANPEYPWRWMRIIQFAKRANEKGRVLRADGRPVTARDLALAHDRNTSTEELWRDLLATCVEEGLLIEEDGIYRVYDWRRWHRKPSDMPDAVAERVRRHRQNRGVTGRYVTPGNECNASEQSRAEHSSTPPSPPPGGAGAGAGQENEGDEGEPKVVSDCLSAAQALHGQALPAKAERKVRDEVEALLQAGHPPDAIGAWCRQACEDLRRDPNGLNVPVFGISRRMRQLASAPPSETPPAGQAKPPRHRVGCRCPVCGIVDDIVRWGLDVPVPPGGKPSPDDLRSLEQACQASATERFLPGLSPDQVRSGIVEALRLVDDVQPHVRAACSALAKHLGKNTPGRASPGPRRSVTSESVPVHSG
jgi:hypothetical protein